jgi:hypothetical protein
MIQQFARDMDQMILAAFQGGRTGCIPPMTLPAPSPRDAPTATEIRDRMVRWLDEPPLQRVPYGYVKHWAATNRHGLCIMGLKHPRTFYSMGVVKGCDEWIPHSEAMQAGPDYREAFKRT